MVPSPDQKCRNKDNCKRDGHSYENPAVNFEPAPIILLLDYVKLFPLFFFFFRIKSSPARRSGRVRAWNAKDLTLLRLFFAH